ncbi:hypothetical protein [Brevibacterium sp. HMSC24B04]|uniref:hypothetical protein n=1 Tax=Brevibacterium sp. HMSC24B04 TaxID=1581060 RepID=UPI0008A229B5|nr:hypothetical protein [Brevibacterium sp. HMSC24B04]OFT93840.1 hypothetical protein HMPREF3092_04540 [Brevibacterium sp. HMSC24B04]
MSRPGNSDRPGGAGRPGGWRREERERRKRGEPSAIQPEQRPEVDLPRRPLSLVGAVVTMSIQGVALLVAAGIYVYTGLTGAGSSLGSLVGLALMFLLMSASMFGIANGLWKYRRWARPAAVAWNVLLLFFAWSVRPGVFTESGDYMFWGPLILGIEMLVLMFLPATLRAYDEGLRRQDEAAQRGAE